jgi:flagellar hook-associated protein 3 FlgL
MYNLTLLNQRNEKVTYGLSSGESLQYGSDDSSQYNELLSINNNVNSYSSILDRIELSNSYNTTSDTAVSNIKTSMESIQTLVLKALTGTTSSDGKAIIAEEIESLKENIYTLSNSNINGQYLFSGKDSEVQAFQKDETTGKISYMGSDDNKTLNVENNTYVTQGLNGKEILFYTDETTGVERSIFDDLDEIINALRQEDSNGNAITEEEASTLLSSYSDRIGDAYDNLNINHAKLGVRNSSIENYEQIVQTKLTNFTILQETYGSADLTSLAIESQSLESTYTALYSTINKINSLSLVKYLS